jgi:hypothetical protein
MKSGKRRGQALVITSQAPETAGPCKGAFHHPALGQKDKAALGLLQLDHDQTHAVGGRRLGRLLSASSFFKSLPAFWIAGQPVLLFIK